MKKSLLSVFVFVFAAQVFAGGILTNTNQSVAFLRNPARDGAIGIDGVYSNPAGVAFLKDGFHFTLNWQCAVQTRTVEETSVLLDHTLSGNEMKQRYRGHATAPCIPSLGAAYNRGKWSFQFNFAVSGGGGKCQYENGLGAFEGQVGSIATMLRNNEILASMGMNALGYGVDCYMEGRQYYYGITLGAAYKITPNLSVYAGIRGLIAHASYEAQLKNIQVATSAKGLMYLKDYTEALGTLVSQGLLTLEPVKTIQPYDQKYNDLVAAAQSLQPLSAYANGVDLSSTQSGFGISPIFGVDWKIGRLNFAAKYEFRTAMSLSNSSNLEKSTMVATSQYENGVSVREDSPALLAFGVQYSPIDIVRINLGYHHFYDRQAKKTFFYNGEGSTLTNPVIVRSDEKNKMLSHGTNEYLAGVEVNCTQRLIVSAGGQITRYGMTDSYMSDQSFVVNSWSFGFGASYQANPNVKIEAAYFKTLYDHYKTGNVNGYVSDYTRSNDVIGVGLVIDL